MRNRLNMRRLWGLSPAARFLDDPPGGAGSDPPADPPSGYVKPDGTFAENWLSHDSVPAELRGSKTLATIKDVTGLASQVVNLEKALGKKRIELPESPDDTERLDAYFRAAGWPEKPDDYGSIEVDNLPEEFQTPEALETRKAEEAFLRQVAHKARLTKPQLALLMKEFLSHEVEQYQTGQGAQAEQAEQRQTALKNKWGAKYALNAQVANTAATAFMSEDQLAHARAAGWFDDPVFLELMHGVGGAISPDRLNVRTDGGVDKGGIQRQLDELMASDVYLKQTGPAHDNAVARAMQLREQLHAAG